MRRWYKRMDRVIILIFFEYLPNLRENESRVLYMLRNWAFG